MPLAVNYPAKAKLLLSYGVQGVPLLLHIVFYRLDPPALTLDEKCWVCQFRQRNALAGNAIVIPSFRPVRQRRQLDHQLLRHIHFRLRLGALLFDVMVLSFSFHLYELVVVGSLEKLTPTVSLEYLLGTQPFGVFDFCKRSEGVSVVIGRFFWTSFWTVNWHCSQIFRGP